PSSHRGRPVRRRDAHRIRAGRGPGRWPGADGFRSRPGSVRCDARKHRRSGFQWLAWGLFTGGDQSEGGSRRAGCREYMLRASTPQVDSSTFDANRRYIGRTSILPQAKEPEMSQIKIATFVGSLRMDSFNRRLARAVEKLAPGEFAFKHVRSDDRPLYSQDCDAAYPAAATRLKKEVESVDGLLFVTPEYNRSIPGVLTHQIDVASRRWRRNSFDGQPGAVLGASLASTGTALAQPALRTVLT